MTKDLKAIILLSGGVDSAACVNYYLKQDLRINGLFIDYGQAVASRERKSAEAIARHYKIGFDEAKLNLNSKFGDGEIKGRNALFLLTALTKYIGFSGIISMGIHDGTIYYDTTEGFVSDMQRLLNGYSSGNVRFDAPFLKWNKPMIYEYCLENKVPIDLTYSCEKNPAKPCGSCNSCLDKEKLNACSMRKA